jgi:hypothetical protein
MVLFLRRDMMVHVLLCRPTNPRAIQVNFADGRYLPEFLAEAVGLP